MSNEITNQSGIIKIEVTKDGKVVTAQMYVDHYLKTKKLHQIPLGDDMIESVLNELNNIQSIPTLD